MDKSEIKNAVRRLENLSNGCKNIKEKTNHEYHLQQIGEILPEIIKQITDSMKTKIIPDNVPFGKSLPRSNQYNKLTPNELFVEDPEYLLWLHLNTTAFTFSDGIRKKLNKFKKENTGIAKKLKD